MIFETELRNGLAVVTINRPPVNAVSPDFVAELHALADSLGPNHEVRAVLFRSATAGRFIAGADLAGVLQQDTDESLPDRLRRLNREWRQASSPALAAPTGSPGWWGWPGPGT